MNGAEARYVVAFVPLAEANGNKAKSNKLQPTEIS